MYSKYPEEIKRKAWELLQKRSAASTLKELDKLFPDQHMPDERTLRRWRHIDPELLGIQPEAASDEISARRKEQHFDYIAEIARLLLDGGLDKITDTVPAKEYTIWQEDYTLETLTHDKLIVMLEGNLDIAVQRYGQWQVFDCLMAHAEAEYPENLDLYNLLTERPLEYIAILRTLALKKIFKGTCPICEDW